MLPPNQLDMTYTAVKTPSSLPVPEKLLILVSPLLFPLLPMPELPLDPVYQLKALILVLEL